MMVMCLGSTVSEWGRLVVVVVVDRGAISALDGSDEYDEEITHAGGAQEQKGGIAERSREEQRKWVVEEAHSRSGRNEEALQSDDG